MLRTDVFVVGGGPAGLATAIAARQRGLAVTVADGAEAPIDRACGEGLMPEAVEALRSIGIPAAEFGGRLLEGIRFIRGSMRAQATFSRVGFGVRRAVLHRTLAERARKAGVELRWNTPVTALCADGVVVAGRPVAARWVVGADGLRSRVARWIGLERGQQEAHFRYALRRHYHLQPWSSYVEVYWGCRMQAYVTPVGREEVCVVFLGHDPHVRSVPLSQEFPELAARLAAAQLTSVERGAITVTRRLTSVYRDRVVLVGDASGSVDAITGEGLSLAFRQAEALAGALAAGDVGQYQRAHRRLMRRPTRMARLLLLLDRHQALCHRAMRALASDTALFDRLLAIHLGGGGSARIATTGVRLGWRLATV